MDNPGIEDNISLLHPDLDILIMIIRSHRIQAET